MPMTTIIIGLAGGTGAGKTTGARVIPTRVGAQHIAYVPHDAYYRNFSDLPKAQRDLINWDHPDSLDTDLMIKHVKALKAGRAGGAAVVRLSDQWAAERHRRRT